MPNRAEMKPTFFEQLRRNWGQGRNTSAETSTATTEQPSGDTFQEEAQKHTFSYLEADDIVNLTNTFSCPLCSIHGVETPCGRDVVNDWKACSEMKSYFFGHEKGGEDQFDEETLWRKQLILERLTENVQSADERQRIEKQLESYDDHFEKSDDFCRVFNDRFFGCMTRWMQSNPQYYQERAGLMLQSFDFPMETTKLYLQMQRYKRYQDEG
eukprot:CAMPEP_0117444418 /NCGR_PEP_ID=MMETSP0759-20121206/5231_1 /TAXON_ID=63605 /ORGANISM="Percolomonas cosmopolitus, Strain WS" /LENGTH=211 /DNA_ID=CAMNT_0005236485 /DNA_START=192 /DNA_END=824 /DNA_ORIENTATION=-